MFQNNVYKRFMLRLFYIYIYIYIYINNKYTICILVVTLSLLIPPLLRSSTFTYSYLNYPYMQYVHMYIKNICANFPMLIAILF